MQHSDIDICILRSIIYCRTLRLIAYLAIPVPMHTAGWCASGGHLAGPVSCGGPVDTSFRSQAEIKRHTLKIMLLDLYSFNLEFRFPASKSSINID